MTYKINGITLTLQPTSGHWLPRESIGIDGNGFPIYPSTYEYELVWGLSSTAEFYEILNEFDKVWVTGTAVVDLPKYRDNTYEFYSYSGCTLAEPSIGKYFAEHPTNIKLLVMNIKA